MKLQESTSASSFKRANRAAHLHHCLPAHLSARGCLAALPPARHPHRPAHHHLQVEPPAGCCCPLLGPSGSTCKFKPVRCRQQGGAAGASVPSSSAAHLPSLSCLPIITASCGWQPTSLSASWKKEASGLPTTWRSREQKQTGEVARGRRDGLDKGQCAKGACRSSPDMALPIPPAAEPDPPVRCALWHAPAPAQRARDRGTGHPAP